MDRRDISRPWTASTPSLDPAVADLGIRWEILETGVTVKLYPSCAATHPPLDALIDMQRREGLTADQIQAIDVEVDSMTPRLLIHPDPATGLEAKFSMPFCAAAAIVYGRLGIDTFDVEHIQNPAVQSVMPRVTLRANEAFDKAAPLSQARVTVRLRDGRVLSQSADGARGYPGRLTDEELATKFAGCASRTLERVSGHASAWAALHGDLDSVTRRAVRAVVTAPRRCVIERRLHDGRMKRDETATPGRHRRRHRTGRRRALRDAAARRPRRARHQDRAAGRRRFRARLRHHA